MEEESVYVTDDVIFIALGTNFEKERLNLLWVLGNFPGITVIIVHVHRPSKWIPIMGAKVLKSLASEEFVTKYEKEEIRMMKALLYKYTNFCIERKVQVSQRMITKEDVLSGIQDLVKHHRIKRLVMASRYMSKQEALLQYCQIWRVCNGRHISTSEAIPNHYQENQEQSDMSSILDSGEYQHYMTPPDELENDIEDDPEEAQTLMYEASESSVKEDNNMEGDPEEAQTLMYEASESSVNEEVQAELLKAKEVEDLRSKLKKAELEARLIEERLSVLEQQVVNLQPENSEEKEIQARRTPRHSKEFTMSDLNRATNNFHSSQKIGEGGYGPVYRGILGHTPIAIKMLNPKGNQGSAEYQQEVLVLTKVRHPNIVILIGTCSQSSALVYEYLPNGSVEEGLICKNNTHPLSWKYRVRIIDEQRSALIFLHSSKPHAIVHADLKLSNMLLDANNISRLGDFGTARLIRQDGSEEATLCRQTTPMGTVGYMDPMFFTSGELTPQSDVYSFGIVILRLLTGLPVLKIAEQVEEGLRMGALHQILDASAGNWPVVQAEQLLRLALKCCCIERRRRPSLMCKDWRTLEILRAMAGNQA